MTSSNFIDMHNSSLLFKNIFIIKCWKTSLLRTKISHIFIMNFILNFKNYMHVPGSMCVWVAGALGVPKRVLGPLKLELQAIVTDPMWVLGTKLGSSVRTVCALNGSAVSAFSHFIFKKCVCVIYVYVHAHVYAEVRGQCWVSSSGTLHLTFWDEVFP